MTSTSEIHVGNDGRITAYIGPDATLIPHYIMVKHALIMLNGGMMLTRGATSSNTLRKASNITGKQYPNNKRGREQAIIDIQRSIDTLKASLPVVNEKGEQL